MFVVEESQGARVGDRWWIAGGWQSMDGGWQLNERYLASVGSRLRLPPPPNRFIVWRGQRFPHHSLVFSQGKGFLVPDKVFDLLRSVGWDFSPLNMELLLAGLERSPDGNFTFKQFLLWYKGLA